MDLWKPWVRRTSNQLEGSTEDTDGADEEVDEPQNQDRSTDVTQDSQHPALRVQFCQWEINKENERIFQHSYEMYF